MRRATPDVIYSYTSAANPVTFTVNPGEVFEVETVPNCGRQFGARTGKFDWQAEGGVNPSTGSIAVEGARPGQIVVVHVVDIRLHEFGYTSVDRISPVLAGIGFEPGWGEARKVVRIRDGFVEWSDRLRIPVAPMIGYMGVARPHETESNAHNGEFGGNFDAPEITTGARIHLPVLVDGARLHVGDVHAVQGDGEIDGAGGIETAGVLTLRVELRERPKRFRNPRIETDGWIATVAFARPAEDAFRAALADLLHWMADEFGFAVTDAHMLLAQVLEARVTQFVNPLFSYICKLRREYLVPPKA